MSESDWQTPSMKKFFETVSQFNKASEVADFMRDVATIGELSEMSKRWEAVILLNEKVSYRVIAEKTGLSTTTVSRVAYWLNNGMGGYKKALNNVGVHHHKPGVGHGDS